MGTLAGVNVRHPDTPAHGCPDDVEISGDLRDGTIADLAQPDGRSFELGGEGSALTMSLSGLARGSLLATLSPRWVSTKVGSGQASLGAAS